MPPFGTVHGALRYELADSPEGLSTFLLRVAGEALRAAPDDATRLRALERWGVGYALSERRLRDVPRAIAEEIAVPLKSGSIHLYRLRDPAPEVALADLPVRVPHLNAAWSLFAGPGFDPRRHVVLPPAAGAAHPDDGEPPRLPAVVGRPGELRVLRARDELLEVEVAARRPSVLVVQRAAVPVWRAAVDGVPVAIEPANLYRIGVPVPAGRHRVLLAVDRGPLRRALGAAAVGGLGLLALASPRPRSRRRGADTMRAP